MDKHVFTDLIITRIEIDLTIFDYIKFLETVYDSYLENITKVFLEKYQVPKTAIIRYFVNDFTTGTA